jgi:2-dehydropantoate 2-reductase
MRYLILGAGALGTVFGAFLLRAGQQVDFLGRGAHFQRLLTTGLRLDGIWGEFALGPVTTPGPHPEPYDIILLCVKSFDTRSACEEARALLAPGGLIISLQNGLGNLEEISRVFGEHRTVGGRVIFGARLPEPGRATVTVYAAPVLLGALSPEADHALLARVARDLTTAGIPTQVVSDIMPPLWDKVLYNCALNALAAILGVPYGALAEHPDTREFMQRIIQEIYAVAQARGLALTLPTAADYVEHFLTRLVPPTAAHRPSMWQDLQAGRPTEIEALNGAICRYGGEMGLPTPYNEAVTRLIRFLERRAAGAAPFPPVGGPAPGPRA